jgi:hypothetical protein
LRASACGLLLFDSVSATLLRRYAGSARSGATASPRANACREARDVRRMRQCGRIDRRTRSPSVRAATPSTARIPVPVPTHVPSGNRRVGLRDAFADRSNTASSCATERADIHLAHARIDRGEHVARRRLQRQRGERRHRHDGRSSASAMPCAIAIARRTPVNAPGPRPTAIASSCDFARPASHSSACAHGNASSAWRRGAKRSRNAHRTRFGPSNASFSATTRARLQARSRTCPARGFERGEHGVEIVDAQVDHVGLVARREISVSP